jgi:hypothetical protein
VLHLRPLGQLSKQLNICLEKGESKKIQFSMRRPSCDPHLTARQMPRDMYYSKPFALRQIPQMRFFMPARFASQKRRHCSHASLPSAQRR